MKEYLPILIQVVVAIIFAASALIVSAMLGKAAKTNRSKDSAYECGMPTEDQGAPRFSVRFYLVAMLFILFDIEVVFLYPWAVVYREFIIQHGPSIFWNMLMFVGVLTAGYVYAIKKGVLDWKN